MTYSVIHSFSKQTLIGLLLYTEPCSGFRAPVKSPGGERHCHSCPLRGWHHARDFKAHRGVVCREIESYSDWVTIKM